MDENNNQAPLPAGTKLDHYSIIKKLGQGGFAMTYLAKDHSKNTPVVIKEYFPSDLAVRSKHQTTPSLLTSDKNTPYQQGLSRFKREALTLGGLNHPNIVKVQMYFERNDTAYFVMEYRLGESLADFSNNLNRPLTEREIQDSVLPVLKGLSAIHNKNEALLHLDIKPGNILKAEHCEPLLIDFGGARFYNAQSSQEIADYTSMVNTKGFTPPEQYSTKATLAPSADLYAFGMTLYSLIAPHIELPESQYRQNQIMDGFTDPLSPIREVAPGYDPALYKAIEACVQLNKANRPQSVAQLIEILGDFYIDDPAALNQNVASPQPAPQTPVQISPQPIKRNNIDATPTPLVSHAESKFAGFWIRFAAALIDMLIMIIVLGIPLLFIYDEGYRLDGRLFHGFWDVMLNYIVPFILTIWFWVRYTATPGKMAMGLKVIDARTGQHLTYAQSVVRYIAFIFSIFTLFLGVIWVGFDKKKQGWHDKLAGTIVVKEKR